MKNFKRLILLLFAFISITMLNPTSASAEWKSNNQGWWNTEGSSWSVGWKQIDGKWYYFYPNGYMAHDTIIDGYNVNSSGAWVQVQPVVCTTNVTNGTSTNTTVGTNVSSNNNISKDKTTKINENTYSNNNNNDKTIIDKKTDEKDNIDNADSDEDNDNYSSTTSTSIKTDDSTSDYYDYSSKSSSEVYVHGYYRNGKYVKPHYRTKKDSTTSNNYSHKGNINPHSGKRGYKK